MKHFAWASYAMYFLAGLMMTTIGSVMPQLLRHYDATYKTGGELIFAGAIGFLLGVPVSTALMRRWSDNAILFSAALLIAAMQLAISGLPPLGAVYALHFVNCMGASAIETVVASLMMERFVGRRAVVMSYLEVAFGVGALAMPMIASLLIGRGVWHAVFYATGGLALWMAVVWRFVRIPGEAEASAASGATDARAEDPPTHLGRAGKGLMLSLFLLMIFFYCGIEGSLNNFISSTFIDYLGESSSAASLSVGVYWGAMVAGRLATGWIIRKVTYGRYLLASIAITAAGLAGFVWLRSAAAGYAVILAIGLAMSGIYSITMVYANHSLPGLTRLVTSLITGMAGLGAAVFPAIVGYAMDAGGPRAALWLTTGFAGLYLAALAAVFALYRKPPSADEADAAARRAAEAQDGAARGRRQAEGQAEGR